jgi:hypothetical protein
MFVTLFNVPLHLSIYVYGVTGQCGTGPHAFRVVTVVYRDPLDGGRTHLPTTVPTQVQKCWRICILRMR